jgi:anti-anti-sigma regulatory factor/HAMP domain-containing protein
LRWYLLTMLSLVLLAALLIVGAGVLVFIARTEQQFWQERQAESAQHAAQTVATFLQHQADTLATVGALSKEDRTHISSIMQSVLDHGPALLEVVYVDQEGNLIAGVSRDTSVLGSLFTIPQSAWFRTTRGGEPYLGDVQVSAQNEPYVIMAAPTADAGVIAARLRMTILWDEVGRVRFGQTSQVYVVNSDGQIIAHTDPGVVLANTRIEERPAPGAGQTSGEIWKGAYTNFQGVKVMGMSATLPGTDWVVVTELAQSEAAAVRNSALGLLGGGLALFGGLVMGVTTLLLNRRVFRPVEQLQAGAGRIARGDLDCRLDIARQDELGRLAASFNMMAEAVQEREEALQRLAATLEQEVQERTAELRQQSEARARLQEEIIQGQAAALAELSTPLIPITDQIVAMPLVGAMDARRSQQVLAALLHGVEASRAMLAILDITGVPVVDTQFAHTLIQVARAVELLGARMILTGIRPEVAQALVGLGVDLSGIVTHSVLQQGITYALRSLETTEGPIPAQRIGHHRN